MAALVAVVAGQRIIVTDVNQLVNLLTGVTGSGTTITLINNAESLIFQPSSDPSAGTRVWTVKNNAGTVLASMRFDGLLKLLAAAADPATAVTGSLYFDTLTSSLKFYDGAAWQYIGGSTALLNVTRTFKPGQSSLSTTVTGTGASSVPAANDVQLLSTGATITSKVSVRTVVSTGATGASGVTKVRSWTWSMFPTQVDANTTWFCYLTNEATTIQPTNTPRHLGIRAAGTTISFSTADGTTEQTTDVSAQVVAATEVRFAVTFDGTTARLYINGTLRATHATNVPGVEAATNYYINLFIVNAAAADKSIYVAPMTILQDPT